MGLSLKGNFVEAIKGRILSGEIKSGERLKSERELAKEYGISRGSINQGILDLERMGFLRIVPRKGTFVVDIQKSVTAETLEALMSYNSSKLDSSIFLDFMDLRILIERDAVRLAILNLTPDSVLSIEKKADYLRESGCNIVEALYEYHKTIVECSMNCAYIMVFESFKKMIKNLISTHYMSENEIEEGIKEIEALTYAIKCRDAYEADRQIFLSLNRAKDYLEKHLKRTSTT